jgi:integrase
MGSVHKRGKYWYVDYYADGKRHRKSHGKQKKFAELHLKEIELQIAREELRIPKDAAIDGFFENFLIYAEAHVMPKTLEKYLTVINNFENFRSKFESANMLSKVTPAFLEDYKLARVKRVSKQTVNHDLKILSIIFKRAVDHNLIKKNPVKDVRRFKVEKKNPRFFSLEEIRLILSKCPERLYPAFMILLHTGMRRGEIANLEWEDVDFERKVIKIVAKHGWSPKGKSEREIPINNELYGVLAKLREKSTGSYVIEKRNVKRYERALWENFWRLAKRLGIRNTNIHTFRHTFASYLIMSGVDLVTVKELLGHRDITTTMRYAHLVPGHKHWAVNRICSLSRMGTKWSQSGKFVM